mgnify:CR=1 FL=1|jgi:hypothetical protein
MKIKKVMTVILVGIIVLGIVKAEGLLQTGNRGTAVTQQDKLMEYSVVRQGTQ